jgi:predicted dehydrogenase
MSDRNDLANGATRRDFLKTAAAGAVAAGLAAVSARAYADGSDTIKVGIIGCGGRGKGAGHNVLMSAPNVEIMALGDAFEDRLKDCRDELTRIVKESKDSKKIADLNNHLNVPDERCFVGLDAYEKVLNSGVNYVILATPPGFRPIHLEAAVKAGKNIFTEKPVAVDGTGIRKVLEVAREAETKGLGVGAGTQRRHQKGYVEAMKEIHDNKALGDLVAGRCYWNQNVLWFKKRQKDWSDLVYQMRNWYNFTWLCGDHIVEQHVHNIDVINWAFGQHPIKAVGMGGRQRSVPNPEDFGQIFDHFAVDFEYPGGVHVLSMCRQIDGCEGNVSEAVVGSKGTALLRAGAYYTINGKPVITRDQDKASTDPYVQEHTDLIASIRSSNKPLNELKGVAESTLSAILGRMSTYTGKLVTWEQALNTSEELMPKSLSWDMKLDDPKPAVPGKTPLPRTIDVSKGG